MNMNNEVLHRWLNLAEDARDLPSNPEAAGELIWELRDALGLPNDTDGRA